MYETLAENMYVTDIGGIAGIPNVTRPIDIEGFNTARVEITVVAKTGGDVAVNFYSSDDNENWTYLSQQIVSARYALLAAVTGLKAKYLRLKLEIDVSGIAIVAMGLHKSNQ